MQAEIITIGDEILIGQVVDTNSAYIASELNKIGISVYQISSVQDERKHLLQALEEAVGRVKLVILGGGLGPTRDDITKKTLCEFTGDFLIEDEEVMQHIEALFKKHLSAPMSPLNREQARKPSRAQILHNAYGTAPGLWVNKDDACIIALPGVPFELKSLMQEQVIPRLMKMYKRPYILHRTIHTYGMGESAIADRLASLEEKLPPSIKLAYLPNLGKVRLRISGSGTDQGKLNLAVNEAVQGVYGLLGDIISGEEESGTLEAGVARLLTEKKLSLATAESFTGGKIAELFTTLPGASVYFKGAVVSYATEIKERVLQVPAEIIARDSVVSEAVAKYMAQNVCRLMGAEYAISTTGNAGPAKGDSEAEIGTVFIGIAGPNGVYAERFHMGNHRSRIVEKSVHKALEMLHKEISKI